MSTASAVTTGSFETEVLQSNIPVLVDFWAVWCGPCKALSPTIDQIAAEYNGKIKVMKLNVDDEPQVASKYGIMSIPTLLIFKNGEVKDQVVGAVPKQNIVSKLDAVIGA